MEKKKRVVKGICDIKYCINKTPKGRNRCNTCKSKQWREKFPIKAAFNNLKASAKKRNIEFTLTLEEFEEFCYETEYIQYKGKTKHCYSVDRIDNDKGYTRDNIRILTVSENASKGKKKLIYDWFTKKAKVVTVFEPKIEDGPF